MKRSKPAKRWVDTAKLRRIVEAATPGKWVAFPDRDILSIMQGTRPPEADRWNEIIHWSGLDHSFDTKTRRRANRRAIVELHNAALDMLDEIDYLRQKVARLERKPNF